MRRISPSLITSGAIALLLAACGDDGGGTTSPDTSPDTSAVDAMGADVQPLPDVTPDTSVDADAATPDVGMADADVADAADVAVDTGPIGPTPEEGDRVVVDLEPYVAGAAGGGAYARQIDSEADLIGGEAATGRVGDWLVGNEHVRFVVQGPSRAIGVCPYGGNLIDGDIVRPAGEPGRDAIGAVCLFLNLGVTMVGEDYEILSDGADGGAVVLAVTGIDRPLDFLNLKGAISQWVGIPLDFAVDPDTDLPGTVTTYYVLRPQDRGVRIVTAVRNDGAEATKVIFGELIDSGGVVEFFNPRSGLKGFGYGGFAEEKMDFLGFKGDETTHVYAPPPLADGRSGAGYLSISGVAGVVLGTDDPLGALLGGGNAGPHEARHLLEPGATVTAERWVYVGDGSLSSATDYIWKDRGVALGHIEGAATDAAGPVAGARISVVNDAGAAITQMVSAADGTFAADVPLGTYTLSSIAPGRIADGAPQVVVEAGAMAEPALGFSLPGALSVHVTNPAGEPTPAKVTVRCDGPCSVVPTSQNRDVTYDFNYQGAIVPLGVSGEAVIPLPPGKYRVVVTRGTSHTLWPADYDTATNPGQQIEVVGGETVELFPVVAKALDTAGWLSGDFHVHAVNSPDAPVHNRDRVRSFMSEAMDVLVSTDHDFITDYAPIIEELGGQKWLTSIVGVELTTFDYGHFNSFPLVADPVARNGGAVDWAGGDGPCLTPDAIFDELHAFPGEQVIQVNHANSGYFFAVDLDAATGMTFADPEAFRMAPIEPDPVTGDTKLWSEKFTALELYNGFSVSKVWTNMNWWLTFLNRGFRVTGTAVTDTHKLIRDPGGVPCSYVRMPEGKDTIAPLDQAAFAAAVNQGRLVGTNGPLLDARLVDPDTGDEAEVGETLALGAGKAMQLVVTIQTPRWYTVDKVEVFSNATSIVTPPGQLVETKPPVAFSQDVDMTEADLMPAVEGGAEGARYVKTVTFDLQPGEDAYYVVLATGNKATSGDLRPIVGDAAKALAFTNPLFVDVDGGGWNPPLDAAKVPAPLPPAPRPGSPGDLSMPVPATRALVERGLIEAREHSCHGGLGLLHEP